MSELYIRQEVLPNLAKIDAILFDIDGVLLDVSGSFRAATIETIQYFAVNELGLEDTGKILEVEDIEAFKFAGGFNDDWDLTCAAAALVVGKWAQSNAKETAALRNVGTTWKEFTDTLKRKGGGIVEAENFVLEMLNPTQRREFARNWNTRLVTRLFQEFYAGDDACKKLYGFEPETIHGHGYYQREVPLIDPVLTPPNLKLGVVTGRHPAEAELGLRHAKMFNRIKPVGWITPENGAKKPDGRTLMMARDALDFSFGLFIGDIMDDLNTVHNYRKLRGAGKARILSAICLTGPGGETKRREFLEAGADIVAPDVNMLLEYLGNVKKEKPEVRS